MKKRGFTLIELLAVIVILAIIALIATPMIMNVIDKAKQGAAEASALGYVDGVEKYAIMGLIDGNELSTGDHTVAELSAIEFKGSKPTDGWVTVDAKGLVTEACLKFSNYSSNIHYTSTAGADITTCNLEKSGS